MNRFIQTILLAVFLIGSAFSQELDSAAVYQRYDSLYNTGEPVAQRADSLVVEEPAEIKSASTAIMYALVLPGLGQAYNHKYFKMPIVWAAIGVAGYAISYNTKHYRQAASDYAKNPDDINQRYVEGYRRNLELSYIGMMVVYALQVLDAYVDAQLYSWDVNEDLSMRLVPSLQPLMVNNSISGQSYGLTCSFNIRGR